MWILTVASEETPSRSSSCDVSSRVSLDPWRIDGTAKGIWLLWREGRRLVCERTGQDGLDCVRQRMKRDVPSLIWGCV